MFFEFPLDKYRSLAYMVIVSQVDFGCNLNGGETIGPVGIGKGQLT